MSDKNQITRPLKGLGHLDAADLTGKTLETPVVQLPRDMYLHLPILSKENPKGCSTEWWWHTGTLVANDDPNRVFGFEINAAAFYPKYVTEVMLTDAQNKKHYHQTKFTFLPLEGWAESDQSKDWKVDLLNVQMHAPQATPTKNMSVKAELIDGDATVTFDLTLSQQGEPFLVWGTGVTAPPTPPTLSTNNYYFSLTRLVVTGKITITVDDLIEEIEVFGTTWMDHEWGLFKNHGKSVKWILQDMQLDNDVCISNFSIISPDSKPPKLNVVNDGQATVQLAGDKGTKLVATTMKPTKSWKSPDGREYFTEIEVNIPTYDAKLTVKALMDDQLFTFLKPIYEGAGTVSGTMNIGNGATKVSGHSWIEQTS